MELQFKRYKQTSSSFPARVAPGEPLWFKDELYIGSVGTSAGGKESTAGTPVRVSPLEHKYASGSFTGNTEHSDFFSGDLLSTYLSLNVSSSTSSYVFSIDWLPDQTAYILMTNTSGSAKTVKMSVASGIGISSVAVGSDDIIEYSGGYVTVTVPAGKCVEVSLMKAGSVLVFTHSAEMTVTSL